MARARAPHRRHAAVRYSRAPTRPVGAPRWLPVGVIAAVVVLVVFALGRVSVNLREQAGFFEPDVRVTHIDD